MKKNLKNIFIPESFDFYPLQSKQIIKTTIINSPNIISSKNNFIIKQYINTKESKKPLLEKNKTDNKIGKFKENLIKNKNTLIYHKQGLNSNNINKNESSILNSTMNIINKKNNFIINNSLTHRTNKTNFNINNNSKFNQLEKPINKQSIESYTYLNPRKNLLIDKKNNNESDSNNLEKFINIKNKRNNNKKNFIFDKAQSKTFENIINQKFNIKNNHHNFINNDNNNNNNNNKNETYNDKTLKSNTSEISLYKKKSPFQKQIIKNNFHKKVFSTIKNSFSNIDNKINNITIEKKDIIDEVKKSSTINKQIFRRKNILDNNKDYKKIFLLEKHKEKEIENNNTMRPISTIKLDNNTGEHLSSPFSDKELNDISDNNKPNRTYSISTFKTIRKNNSLPKTSLRFLINRASKDKSFGESFHKAFEKNKNNSVGKSLEKVKNKNILYKNDKKAKIIIPNEKDNDSCVNYIYKSNTNTNFNVIYKEKESKCDLLFNNLETIKKENSRNNLRGSINSFNKKNYQENTNTNNIFSKTSNNFKPGKKVNYFLNLTKNKSNDNIFIDSNINKFDGEQDESNNEFVIVSSVEPNIKSSNIDIELLYHLENKILDLYGKIKKYLKFEDESFEIINYYFKNDISKTIIQLFNSSYYKNIIISYIKTELLAYFLFYDICLYNCLDKIILLIKPIINYIQKNFLLLIKYIINKYENQTINLNINKKNRTILLYLKNIIKQNINFDLNEFEMTEGYIIKIIMEHTKCIIKYYKLILEKIYKNDYISLNNDDYDNDLKFPYIFKYFSNISKEKTLEIFRTKRPFIISSFFFESYQLLNNYSIFDLENFFYSFLDRTKTKIYIKNNEFILPKIDDNKYKYTLVLDLDETLVHCNKKGNNKLVLLLRPGLIEFLQKMRNICELILFSFGSSMYVESIMNVIEKDEKFFEYVLDRSHGIYQDGHYIKDLNMLNRDLNNIIIIDDSSKYFQLQEENGICIKPFKGDIENDKNTLKVLAKILEKIFNDANTTKDVRISLKKYKKLLTMSNIIN